MIRSGVNALNRLRGRLTLLSCRVVLLFAIVGLLLAHAHNQIPGKASAQSTPPILFSVPESTRGLAVESVSRTREPFAPTASISFAKDNRTRIMLIAGNLRLAPGEGTEVITADAEDASHHLYPLKVEYVGPVPDLSWATSVVVRLNDQLGDVGDVLVRIFYKGNASNRVRVGIGHVGGGPPDDPGAIPTPGPTGAPFTGNPITAGTLTTGEVQTIISQAVSAAVSLNKAVTVAVTDREGNVLGVFKMTDAPAMMQIRGGGPQQTPDPITGLVPIGLEGTRLPSTLGAISKAGTAALFSTSGNAFTTRTASFIIQEHFPPGVAFQASGPLYGVQYSSLPCSDIKIPGLPLGLAGDPGGIPIYKGGIAQGGIGIEGDGVYGIDQEPSDFDQPFEEIIGVSAIRSFEPPGTIRANNILVNGIRLPFANAAAVSFQVISFGTLPGSVDPLYPIRSAQPSAFTNLIVGGIGGESDPRFFPFISSPGAGPNALTAADVDQIIAQAARQANITRAAIRQPLGSNARVTIAVVDVNGVVLGLFRQQDAPVFGFDVSVQKARTAAFMSSATAGAQLRSAGFGVYVDRAGSDGIRLDGAIAFSDRAVGFLHRPFFPDGIQDTAAGPLSTDNNQWSVFNVGLQLDLIKTNFEGAIGGAPLFCSSIPSLHNGMQIFPGSLPLYKNGVLVGAIGVSGDGVEQDDLIGAAGGNGYSPPSAIRSDQVFVRGVRLPFLKFPRSPNL